jgi:hypothetical protein
MDNSRIPYHHFCLSVDEVARMEWDKAAEAALFKIDDFLDMALEVWTEIEMRRARQSIRGLNFF